MKVLVVGASGATGRLLVHQLLENDCQVKAVVRNSASLSEFVSHNNLEIIQATLLDLSNTEMSELTADCNAIASCLGHNLSWKGIYGKPRKLVTDAAQRLCKAAKDNNPEAKIKYVLMNTTGNRNRDLNEPRSLGERMVIGLLRVLVPPHPDNEQAAEYLRTRIGQTDPQIDWCAVRPDTLIDEETTTPYEVVPSPKRSPIFNSGKTSRINVAHFMADLILNEQIWDHWKGKMPVVYNAETD